jgi:chromosome segregation ATPase
MEMNQIQMYEILKTKLGEKETKVFVHLIDEKMDAKINARKHELATKEDISVLKSDITSLRSEFASLRGDFASLRGEFASLKDDMASHRLSTTKDVASLREDMAAFRFETTKNITSVREDMLTMRNELTRTIYVASLGQLLGIVACVISLIMVFVKK